ncbi:MAG: outer rane efflux protein [Gemmatimonadetes bacterium]|nr:outer rane efflux protein [Gemmatimonadota bacterium]
MRAAHRIAMLVAIAAGAASPALAQVPTTAPTTISFPEALQIALRQNTTLRQAENTATSSSVAVRQQQLSFLPSLSVSTSGAENVGRSFSQSDGAIVDQTTQSVSAGLSSGVTLFNGGKNVASLREARLGEQASNSQLTRARQTTAFTVAQDYVSLVTFTAQVRVQRENYAAQQAQLDQIQRFVTAGARSISDLYQQQASVASAQSALVSAERDVELAKVDLMQVLQLDPRGTFEFTAPAVADSVATVQFSLDSLLTRAFAQRTDLAAQQSRVAASVQGVKGAAAGLWPSISLSLGYNSAYSSATALSFSDQLNQRRGGSVGVGISIPLFDRGATSAAKQLAQVQEENARLALDDQRQSVALEVRRAWLDHQAARQLLVATTAQQKAADLAVSATQQRYQIGSATLLEATQARAAALQAAVAVVNARYTLFFRQALMSYYTGDLDPVRVTLG